MSKEAVDYFKKGAIVIFPTDTVYGIGCCLSNKAAIKRLYKLRRTPFSKPTLILAADSKQASKYGYFDKDTRQFVERFWPGPVTVIVKAKPLIPKIIQGGAGTIAIRVPNQPALLKIIEKIGEPILAPSANFHNQPTPASFAKIDRKLLSLVDYSIDLANLGDFLPMLKKPSTVVDLTKIPYQMIRVGTLSEDKIKNTLGGSRK